MNDDETAAAPAAFATRQSMLARRQIRAPVRSCRRSTRRPPTRSAVPACIRATSIRAAQNPTRFAYERCIADLESGTRAFAFASGLAAVATVLDLLQPGDHVVAGEDLYGGSRRLFTQVRQLSAGLKFSFVDLCQPTTVEAAIGPDTRLIWVETPSNPMLKLADLSAIAAHRPSASPAGGGWTIPLRRPICSGLWSWASTS